MATASVFPQFPSRRSASSVWCIAAACALWVMAASPCASALGSPTDLRAVEPSPEDIAQAARYFDEGRDAFRRENYIEAAEAFEKADALAPNPKVLLLAIQSRELGGHLDRAATLAVLAEQRHPKDALFADLGDLLKTARNSLNFLTITCESPCQITVGNRLLHGPAATRRYLFLQDGKYRIRATWGQGEALSKYYEATAGTRGKLRFDSTRDADEGTSGSAASYDASDEAGVGEKAAPVAASGSDDEDDWGDGEDWGEPAEEEPAPEPKPEVEPDGPQGDGSGAAPIVFWSGVAATGILVGLSTWSGIDTLQHPGTDVVVAKCVGLGESCPEYQEGLRNQRRTNILWGVTGGVGVITALVGAFWTDWGATPNPKGEQTALSDVSFNIVPVFSDRAAVGAQQQIRRVTVDGSLITATGRF